MPGREPYAVTGLGAVSAAGVGTAALWASASTCRLAPIARFASRGELAGVVPGYPEHSLRGPDTVTPAQALALAFAVTAAREALADAGLDPRTSRVGLVLGSNIVDRPRTLAELAADLATSLGLTGPRLAASTACASSTTAIGVAFELLALTDIDAVLVGGADALAPILLAGFRTLKMLAPDRCAPFSSPSGTSLGEGAGFLVLEPLARARARNIHPTLALRGYDLAADANHPTRPDPRGEGLVRSLGGALEHAAIPPTEVAYINLHGTGTDANDDAECQGMVRLFGERATTLPVSASKSLIGHTQGAAGALEAVLTLLARRRGLAPPTLQFTGPRPGCSLDVIGEGVPRRVPGDVVCSYNAGFGGANAAVVFASVDRPPVLRPRRTIHLTAHTIAAADPGDERGDPTTRALQDAVTAAIDRAAIAVRRDTADHVALWVAQPRVSPTSYHRLLDAVDRRGLDRLSTTALVRALLVSPAGACSEALGLRGPLCVLGGDRTGVLLPLVLAAQRLATRDDHPHALAAHTDESDARTARAEAVALTADDGPIALLGWSLAADPTTARAAALAHAGLLDAPTRGSLDLAALLPGEPALILAEDPTTCSCAVVLVRRQPGHPA